MPNKNQQLQLENLNISVLKLTSNEIRNIRGGMKWDREKYKDSDLVINCRNKDRDGRRVCTRGGKIDEEATKKYIPDNGGEESGGS